jgi:hypothetical protein
MNAFIGKVNKEADSLVSFPLETLSLLNKAEFLWGKDRTEKEEMALGLLLHLIETVSTWRPQTDEEDDMKDAWVVIGRKCAHMKSKYSDTRVRLYLDREYHNSVNPNIIKQNWFKL